ncbi:MAG: CoA transferase subunit A [Desulfocucumaceae bacterium]
MRGKKIVSLHDAVSIIQDGDIVLAGGLIDSRRPMAAMYEIMRQKRKNLIFLAFLSLEDPLVGAGCIGGVRGCYTHMGIFGKGPCTQRAVRNGRLIIDDIGHVDSLMTVAAPAMGLPFVGSPYSLGTDILNPDYSRVDQLREIARNKHKIPKKKYEIMEDPFYGGKVVLFPGIKPDVAVIHVTRAGTEGTCRTAGALGMDMNAAFAADRVIITAEEIVPEEFMRREPNQNFIPCTEVDYIVQVPWGAHPSALPGVYDLDLEFVMKYQAMARTEEGFSQWAKDWVYDIADQFSYLDRLGSKKLESLKAVEPFGFRPRVDLAKFLDMREGGV